MGLKGPTVEYFHLDGPFRNNGYDETKALIKPAFVCESTSIFGNAGQTL